jgi:Mg-chelatase subunit ChlD
MVLDPSETVSENNSAMDSFEEVAPPDFAQDQQLANVSELATSAGIGVGSSNDFSSAQARQSASGGGEDFDGLIQRLRRDGLDIVIVFDSTGSMSGEINEVKDQIDRIGGVLTQMVPKTRISIVTYRDETDSYLVKGTPLTSSVDTVTLYLDEIRAAGGGDEPEAVHSGLNWAMSRNRFRSRARKVVLLFGDAPPHRQYLGDCLNLAQNFNQQQGGVVSTVTCRASRRMDEFVEIAQMGGGESFLTSDEREIMTQLIVLVFGSEHRRKVLDAFKLLDR